MITDTVVEPHATTTAPGFVPRLHGVVLTNASIAELGECMRRGQHDIKKVIADERGGGWGTGGSWTDALRRQVLNDLSPWLSSPGHTIVRTVAGDSEQSGQTYYDQPGESTSAPSDPRLYPMPERVIDSIGPWYRVWDRRNDLYVEIGNEPNHATWWACYNGTPLQKARATDFIHKWRQRFAESMRAIRQNFPGVKVISPGLADHFEVWYDLCRPEFSQADLVGWHILEGTDFYGGWNRKLFPVLQAYYGGAAAPSWFGTEVGLNYLGSPYNNAPPWNNAPLDAERKRPQCWGDIPNWWTRKGIAYAEAIHFGRSDPPWPAKVVGTTYYHLETSGTVQPQYNIYNAEGDYAYRHRVNVGNRMALRPMNGTRYVCAEGSNSGDRKWALVANRAEVQSWETFERVLFQDWVALKSAREVGPGDPGQFVAADLNMGGLLIANRNHTLPWELFQILPSKDDRRRVAIKSNANNMFVRAEAATGWELRADYPDPTLRPRTSTQEGDPAWSNPNHPIWFEATAVS